MKIQLVRFRLSHTLAIALLLTLSSLSVFGDTVKLKNGSVIKGKVVSFGQGEFTVILDLGASTKRSTSRMIIAAEDVESIEFDGADTGGSSVRPGTSEGASRDAAPATRPAVSAPEATTPPPVATEPDTSSDSVSSASNLPVLFEKEVRVAAAADWTSTEIKIQKGQRISITASGEVDLGSSQRSGANGIPRTDSRKLMANRPTGALIAVIGDDNDNFLFIGKQAEFASTHTGILFLSINEGDLKDNTGSFVAKVKVMAAK